ncbi:hypothetical protein TNCV_4101941 [Trichonephila clavipes]|nr:hypothetical protein TNCV_4101941 [Trichonephila clavipes]
MDDNAHKAYLVDEYLQSEGIQRLERLVSPLDFNPIEHVWNVFEHSIVTQRPALMTIHELRCALMHEWVP